MRKTTAIIDQRLFINSFIISNLDNIKINLLHTDQSDH